MKKDNHSYNPHFQYPNEISFFQKKIKFQDEVPDCFVQETDSMFKANQIIQVDVGKDFVYQKSIFHSSQLKPSGGKLNLLNKNYSNWSSFLLVFCFFVIALVRYNNFKRIQQVFKAFVLPRFFSQMARESNSFTERPTMILVSLYIVVLSFIITHLYTLYAGLSPGMESFIVFGKVLVAAILFYLLKIALVSFSGMVFKASKEAGDYILSIYLFCQIMGMVLFPFAVISAYNYSEIVLGVFFAIFSISYIYRLFQGALYISSALKVPVYYLFFYLCTLEILPLVILVKFVLLMLN